MISAAYYASAWFITIFTNSIKQTSENEDDIPENLMMMWDYFLMDGWKAVLKTGLFLLKDDSEILL